MIDTLVIMSEALTHSLEKMAFLMVLPMEEELGSPASPIMAQIDFSGPRNGTIQIACGMRFASCMAENLGGMTDASESQCRDAAAELVNVTCGLVLPLIAGSPGDVFDVTVPHIEPVDWSSFVSSDDAQVLNVEDMPIAAKLTIKD